MFLWSDVSTFSTLSYVLRGVDRRGKDNRTKENEDNNKVRDIQSHIDFFAERV